jgi:hypothetical protein
MDYNVVLAEALDLDADNLKTTLDALGLLIRRKPKTKRSTSFPIFARRIDNQCTRCSSPVEKNGAHKDQCLPCITEFVNKLS